MRLSRFVRSLTLIALCFLGFLGHSAHAQCLGFSRIFAPDGVSGSVSACAVFDNGTGPVLYVGGSFTRAGAVSSQSLASWNGSGWLDVGVNVAGRVDALLAFDDGTGPALYAGGSFSSIAGVPAVNIAKWNGTSWTALGSGTNGEVFTLCGHDDGFGPALYVGGRFSTAGGQTAHYVAKWKSGGWLPLGQGMNLGPNNLVSAMVVYDNGTGPAVFAAGTFENADGAYARSIAKWDGFYWQPVGGGLNYLDGYGIALAVYDDGTGPSLYLGGTFYQAGSTFVSNIARWNGTAWSDVGYSGGATNGSVFSLRAFDDGSGSKLYAGGTFTSIGGASAQRIAAWNGSSWSAAGSGVTSNSSWPSAVVNSLCAFDAGNGPELYAGGNFSRSNNIDINNIAHLSGSDWRPLGTQHGPPLLVSALGVFDDGTGPALFVGGNFRSASGIEVEHVARWDGTSWTDLAGGTSGGSPWIGAVEDFATFDDGSGRALYATGSFLSAGGVSVNGIARWNGTSWSALGTGFGSNIAVLSGEALAVFDDGSGAALFACGTFDTAGGVAVNNIARWDGTQWSALGSGLNGQADSLTVFNDGSGNALYVAGSFYQAGGASAKSVARWDGTNWSAVGTLPGYSSIDALCVFDDGHGAVLYGAGYWGLSGQTAVPSVMRWDGTNWAPIGSSNYGVIRTLGSFNDGSGPALYAGGDFQMLSGVSAYRIAKWDGSAWSALDSGIGYAGFNDGVYVLCTYSPPGSGATHLFAGGQFPSAGGMPSQNLAEWVGCGHPGTSMCFGDGTAAPCPCGNNGVSGHGCQNSAATGGALLDSSGWNSLAFDSVVLGSSAQLPNVLSIFLQGNVEIAPTSFGDGLRCAGGNLKRLYVHNADASGNVSAPVGADLHIASRSAQLGDTISAGQQRVYQVYYRDPNLGFCPSPLGSSWNVSSGLRLEWLP